MISSEQKTELRERMLAADPISPPLRAEYQRKVIAMFEVQLTSVKKAWIVGLILSNVLIGGGALSLVLTERLPPRVTLALAIGIGFTLAWTIYFIQMLRRGVYRRRMDGVWGAGMKFGFALIMCALLAIAGVASDIVLLAAMFAVVPAGLFVVHTIVDRSEMRTQERLVELQYRIAKLSERLGGDEDDDDDDMAGAGVRR
jgi:hypothetical protein